MRIIVADHHFNVRRALVDLVSEIPEFTMVGEASNAQELLSLVMNSTADLILLDHQLPGDSIAALLASLHAHIPRPYIVVMSSNPENSRLLLLAGADSFVSKADQPEWLIQILRENARKFTKLREHDIQK